ncbi:hypothetical protein [Vibrio campbellii]|uniref:hypothetical protein n=1 Tax=Vibrio campbellii TaxID=680 RepID=UPI00210AD197|nr:hypothetical protein [Vibrio campbellii]
MELNFLDQLLETGGELVGGAVDAAGEFGNDWLGIKIGNELDRAESASPDENRKDQEEYQQPNGDVVREERFKLIPDSSWPLIGGFALLIIIIIVLVVRKR